MGEQLYTRTADIDRQVGARVRSARIAAGLSQSRLASELGVTFQQLQKYEKGRNRIAVGTLLLIADALSLSVHRFFDTVGDALAPRNQDSLQLVAAFDRIVDPEVRRRILTLVLAVTENADLPVALAGVAAPDPVAPT